MFLNDQAAEWLFLQGMLRHKSVYFERPLPSERIFTQANSLGAYRALSEALRDPSVMESSGPGQVGWSDIGQNARGRLRAASAPDLLRLQDFFDKVVMNYAARPSPREMRSARGILLDKYQQREAIRLFELGTARLKKEPAKVVLEDVNAGILATDGTEPPKAYLELMREQKVFELEIKAGKRKSRIPSGLELFDDLLGGGFSPGTIVGLAARPKVGKSRLALKLALEAALNGWQSHFFALEMGYQEVGELLANYATNQGLSRRLRLDEPTLELLHVNKCLNELPMHIHRGRHLNDIKGSLRWAQATSSKPIFLVVDYLQLVQAPGTDYERVTLVSQELAHLARQTGAVILATLQFNRSAAEGQASAHKLRGSGQIEQDLNQLFILSREEKDGNLDLTLNRHGPRAEVQFEVDMSTMKTREIL